MTSILSTSGEGDVELPEHKIIPPEEKGSESEAVSMRTFLRSHDNSDSNRNGELSQTQVNLRDPMRKLAVETISIIFGYCLPVLREGLPCAMTDETAKTNIRTLFRLGAICTTWRAIAWSTPRLWSLISMHITLDNLVSSIVIAKEWLKRSGEVPLSVEISFSHPLPSYGPSWSKPDPQYYRYPDKEWHENFAVFSDVINASSSRWKNLDIQLPSELLPLFSGTPSKLREVLLHNRESAHSSKVRPAHIGSLSTPGGIKPAPTYVHLADMEFETFDILWNNVTCVHITAIYIDDLLDLLRQAPAVTEATFTWLQTDTGSRLIRPLKPIVHDTLRSIHLEVPYAPNLETVFFDDILTLPGLEYMKVILTSGCLRPRDFESFLKRSACTLKKLVLIVEFDDNTAVPLLRLVPSLRSLILQPTGSGRHDFSSVDLFKLIARTSHGGLDSAAPSLTDGSYASTETSFLPCLRELSIVSSSSVDCNNIWDLVPDLFGIKFDDRDPLDSGQPTTVCAVKEERPQNKKTTSARASKRPWKKLHIEQIAHGRHESRNPEYISKPTLARMDVVEEAGISLEILSHTEDFIEISKKFHAGEIQTVDAQRRWW